MNKEDNTIYDFEKMFKLMNFQLEKWQIDILNSSFNKKFGKYFSEKEKSKIYIDGQKTTGIIVEDEK
jgi:hypothetical protein